MGAALPLRPCGAATRRRPSRRGPQRPWGNKADVAPPGKHSAGGKSQAQEKKGESHIEDGHDAQSAWISKEQMEYYGPPA